MMSTQSSEYDWFFEIPWVQTPNFRLLNGWSFLTFFWRFKDFHQRCKASINLVCKSSSRHFIENVLVPGSEELWDKFADRCKLVFWQVKASLFLPCDDVIIRDFRFNENISYYPVVDSFSNNYWKFQQVEIWTNGANIGCFATKICSFCYIPTTVMYITVFFSKKCSNKLYGCITFLFKSFTVSFSSEQAIHSRRAPQLHFPTVNVSKFAQHYLELFLKILMKE